MNWALLARILCNVPKSLICGCESNVEITVHNTLFHTVFQSPPAGGSESDKAYPGTKDTCQLLSGECRIVPLL